MCLFVLKYKIFYLLKHEEGSRTEGKDVEKRHEGTPTPSTPSETAKFNFLNALSDCCLTLIEVMCDVC